MLCLPERPFTAGTLSKGFLCLQQIPLKLSAWRARARQPRQPSQEQMPSACR